MCGFAGILDKNGRLKTETLRAAIERMNRALGHRGPDDGGIWLAPDGRMILGHRRLSVIDTTAHARQPMATLDGRSVLAFNGEIYNYRSLRQSLERDGCRFRSQSDTEVLLETLARKGSQAVSVLDGMFAFAYYDTTGDELILARDPFGEKPLYYWDSPDFLVFASELTGILQSGLYNGQVEPDEVAAFFFFRYLPHPWTIFRDIRKLSPGSVLTCSRGRLETRRYYRFRAVEAPITDVQEATRLVEDELTRSVESRLMSDVPLGAFLSGGVDSSLVCALAAKKLGMRLDTYTIGFDQGASEHAEAQAIAEHLGTRHHVRIIGADDLLDTTVHLGAAMDEPNGDRSCVPTHILSRYVRSEITVALSGDGGDELFCGYGRYASFARSMAESPSPDWVAQYFSRALPVLPPDQLMALFDGLPNRFVEIYTQIARPYDTLSFSIGRLRELDAETYLPGAVLAKVDRMSMAHGLEVRAPLLNTTLARLAGTIPLQIHTHDGRGKYLLRRILKQYLPDEWVDRQKSGFGMPASFFRAHARFFEQQQARILSGDSPLAQVLDLDRLRGLLPRFNPNGLWASIVLHDWLAALPNKLAPALAQTSLITCGEGTAPTPTEVDLLTELRGKRLPLRAGHPPGEAQELVDAFDALELPEAQVNVFTFHVGIGEDYTPIETGDVKGGDHRAIDYDYMLAFFSHAARTRLGNCNLILVSDRETIPPSLHCFDRIVRLPIGKRALMYDRVRAMAAYVNSRAFHANTAFLDSDVILGDDLEGLFQVDFDLALTFRASHRMVINEGVQFASRRRPAAVRHFYNGYLHCYQALLADPCVQAHYPHGIERWRGGQLSLNLAGWDGVFPFHGERRELDGVRLMYLDCDEYNYKPKHVDSFARLRSKKAIHLKGNAKTGQQVRQLALRLDIPGWAERDWLLTHGPNDGELIEPRITLAAIGDFVRQGLPEAARNLCLSLLERADQTPFMKGLLYYQLGGLALKHEYAPERARRLLLEAKRYFPLLPEMERDIGNLLAETDHVQP